MCFAWTRKPKLLVTIAIDNMIKNHDSVKRIKNINYLKGRNVKNFSYICKIISKRSTIKGPWSVSKFNFRNNGSLWELYLQRVMIQNVHCYSLINCPFLNPHAKIEYCRCGRIKELYKMWRMCVGRKVLKRHIVPRVRAFLFEIFNTRDFQLRCLSIVRTRKVNSLNFTIVSEFIFSLGTILFIFRW